MGVEGAHRDHDPLAQAQLLVAQPFFQALPAAAQDARREKARLEAIIKEEWRVIDADIARVEARKREIIPLIEPELLALYEELRPHKERVAVGRLAEGVCGGCHLRLSAAEQVEVLREFPPRCIHCRRILVPQ